MIGTASPLTQVNIEAKINIPFNWSTTLIRFAKIWPCCLFFLLSFMRLVIMCWQSSVNSIADVCVVRWNVPHLKTWLQFLSCWDFWDPLHIMEFPASCAATVRSRDGRVQSNQWMFLSLLWMTFDSLTLVGGKWWEKKVTQCWQGTTAHQDNHKCLSLEEDLPIFVHEPDHYCKWHGSKMESIPSSQMRDLWWDYWDDLEWIRCHHCSIGRGGVFV